MLNRTVKSDTLAAKSSVPTSLTETVPITEPISLAHWALHPEAGTPED